MKRVKRLVCGYCKQASIHSADFEVYICDDCYEKKNHPDGRKE